MGTASGGSTDGTTAFGKGKDKAKGVTTFAEVVEDDEDIGGGGMFNRTSGGSTSLEDGTTVIGKGKGATTLAEVVVDSGGGGMFNRKLGSSLSKFPGLNCGGRKLAKYFND